MPSDSWTPLWSSIVWSSVWDTALHVRVMWITMLALKDGNGYVRGTVKSMARAAHMTEEEARDAVGVLCGADEESATRGEDGRRLREVEGGWEVVNAGKYQKLMVELNRRRRQREWVAEKRMRLRGGGKPLPGEGVYERILEAEGREAADAWQARVSGGVKPQ